MDAQVGKVLAALKEAGLKEKTIVIFAKASRKKIVWRSFWDGGTSEGPIASRWLQGVGNSSVTLGVVAVILGAVGLGASWVPALRASSVEPVEALRYE